MLRDNVDWRLTDQDQLLHGTTLCRQPYVALCPTWDHDHCAFCWAKFMDHDAPGALRKGYSTADKRHWVCDTCANDFKERFAWTLTE